MIESVFSTETLPKADRWAAWYDMASREFMTSELSSQSRDDFHGNVRLVDLGAAQVSTVTYNPLRLTRTPKMIRQSDPELYQLSLALRGTFALEQAGRETVTEPRDLMLCDSSRPFRGQATAEQSTVSHLVLQFPRTLFPVSTDALDQITAVRLPGQRGMGALLARHLIEIQENACDYTPADAARLTSITLDLLAALCAHHLEAVRSLPPETRRTALQVQLYDFIQRRLGDPMLSPDTIAAAHHISARHLQSLFQEQGLAVASWIRGRRLERCHRDLADPHLRSIPIHALAARWGFTDAPHFSRTFRRTYGMSPREYRALTLPDVRGQTTTVRGWTRTS
ncbi:helix-turn-helix domain-containing protein [Streptomyces sp. NBC_01317]|uniref:AraC-like ligand-binding domain-containing protein n=1 Tax=Streptomyces sp. NBC_01317 TaxID=2903822 RepID=UPI002E0F186D|nr:helix-turn-helix domain-containing protein [Streptomyces sp. NBC_01317]